MEERNRKKEERDAKFKCFVEVTVLPRGRINWDIVSNEQLLGNNVQKATERLKRTNDEEVGINGTRKAGIHLPFISL